MKEFEAKVRLNEENGGKTGELDIMSPPPFDKGYFNGVRFEITFKDPVFEAEKKSGWIPLKYRPMDEDEYRAFREVYGEIPVEGRKVFACQMPEDGQEILISTKYGNVFLDTCVYDGEFYELEEYGDWWDVIAWMPLPTPYKEGEAE